MSTLRNATIRLAYENPDLQKYLIPILQRCKTARLIEENPVEDVLKYGHDALTSFVRSQGNPFWKVTKGMFHRNGGVPKFTWVVSDENEALFTVSTIRHTTMSFSRMDGGEDDRIVIPTKWVWGATSEHDSQSLGSTAGEKPKIPSRELKLYLSDHFR